MPTRTISRTFLILLLAAGINICYSDLPIHCLKSQIVGKWKLEISDPETVNFPYRMNCGHENPDNPANSYLALRDSFESTTEFEVELKDDSKVHQDDEEQGQWTMVYDEGMDVVLGNHRFTSFFDYFPNATGKVMNYCGKTVVGWYKNLASNKMACFRAEKIVDSREKEALYVEPIFQMAIDKPEANSDFLQMNSGSRIAKARAAVNTQTVNHEAIAARLNQIPNKGWTAKAHSRFAGKNFKQLNEFAGRKKNGIARQNPLPPMSLIETDVSDLPKEFNWKDAIHRTRDQGDCGSCYTFATVAMLEARLKMKYNKDIRLSRQHVLDCSMENQGCEGGYPFLVGMFGFDNDLVPEDCSSYLAKKGGCQRCDPSKLDEVYRVSEYGFVGGSYGKSTARGMMLELKKNGPLVVSFQPTEEFMYYSGGIFKSLDLEDWVKYGLEKPEWEQVGHSVLLYGWGETDEGVKYWLIQNSWGTDWGEDGSFRMLRGVDESRVESVGEWALPYIVGRE